MFNPSPPPAPPAGANSPEKANAAKSAILKMKDLPTLPAVVMRVVELAHDENVTARKLKEVIVTDPPLSAKVLKVANSAHYARREATENIDQAIVTIGLNELINICASTGMISSMDVWDEKHLNRADIWKHSLSVAFLAKSLGLRKDMVTKDSPDLFLVGLLHNIGWIVIDQIFTEQLAAMLEARERGTAWTLDFERQHLGLTHSEIGAIFLERWGLSREVTMAVAHHHDADYDGEFAPEAALVGLASTLSELQFGLDVKATSISPHIPHLLEQTEGPGVMREMQNRYAANVNQAKAMSERMLSWIF